MSKLRRTIYLVCGATSCALGLIGIVVPVLPTTPLLLLAAFLFSRSSERLNTWLMGTKAYRLYVVPFKESGGIPLGRKLGILGISYGVMAISAILVRRWYVWAILGAVAVFLLWLMLVRIPTVSREDAARAKATAAKEVAEA
ncbi:MAG: YbaN family protein [Eggerthellaceae bacterium]|nr:YbaN family protein [Eggerthellaceae bacterium]